MKYKMMEFELEGHTYCAMNVRVPFDEFLGQASILLGKTVEELRPLVQSKMVRFAWHKVNGEQVRTVEPHTTRGFGIENIWAIDTEGLK